MVVNETKHIALLSGGHSSAKVAIYLVENYGTENVILLNHNISPRYEDADIKRYKHEIAEFIGLPITYANINGISDENNLPSQFQVCIDAGALTDNAGHALCTNRLKTEPFEQYLKLNFPAPDLFTPKRECVVYYGFDLKEHHRVTRRVGIMAALGYRCGFPLLKPNNLTITDTRQIGIEPPLTYDVFEHANCIGCLKASLLHWYVTYVWRKDVYEEGMYMEEVLHFTIHTIIRNNIKRPIPLIELMPIFERMKIDGISATEHQSKMKFARMIKDYQLEECVSGKPCECFV